MNTDKSSKTLEGFIRVYLRLSVDGYFFTFRQYIYHAVFADYVFVGWALPDNRKIVPVGEAAGNARSTLKTIFHFSFFTKKAKSGK